ncbi:MAG: type IV secretory system conjugative DNA transfer family protein [Phycisphaerales bacterium JB040]
MTQPAGQPGTARRPGRRFPLSSPLVRLTPSDTLTLRDAFEGIHIFGGLGSGKTSGSGRTFARAFLRAGFGGLVLTAKPDEPETWMKYCRETGREDSVILFGPGHDWRFNFIDYEMRRAGPGAGITSNLVALFEEVLEVQHPGKVLGGDPYWREARGQLLRNALDLVRLSLDRVSFEEVAKVIRSAPRTRDEPRDPQWRASSRCAELMRLALERTEGNPKDQRDLQTITDYFFEEFAPLDPEPRSSIVSMVGALTDTLLRGDVRELLMTKTTMLPDLIEHGVVVIMDMPLHEYRDAGRFVQVLMKTIFQRMIERRNAKPSTTRPVFLWADESQLFSTSYDPTFQTTARSTKTATVYLTQNLPNYYDAFGGDAGGRDRAKKLLGSFGIKIFHANGDTETNQYGEQLAGSDVHLRHNRSITHAGGDDQGLGVPISTTLGSNEVVEPLLPARVFTELKRGGYEHGYTEAIAFRAGDPWNATGRSFMMVKFRQNPPRRRRPGPGGYT